MICRLLLLLMLLLAGCHDASLVVSDRDAQSHLAAEAVSPDEFAEALREVDDPTDEHLLAAPRSGKWNAVRNAHLRKFPECAACGKGGEFGLYVHHIQPFHLRPELELESSNLITFCYEHHLQVGHFGNWRQFNPNCVHDAAAIREGLGLPKMMRESK